MLFHRQKESGNLFARGKARAGKSRAPKLTLDLHTFKVASTTFEVEKKYKYVKTVGTGAYGIVIAAEDVSMQSKVAIKKVSNAFEDLIDAKRILRELKFLRHFNHENIIALVDIPIPLRNSHGHVSRATPGLYDDHPAWSGLTFEDVYIVSELMDTDLHKVIYSKQHLSLDHVQYFVYQTLRALKYIHSAGVIHRDLKPSNLLVNANCDLKICDFGLARFVNEMSSFCSYSDQGDELDSGISSLTAGPITSNLTEYVVTRWYRAPEVMLSCRQYNKKIDTWAVGCIFAEMLLRKPLFPGNDYIHQLQLFVEILGKPSAEDLDFVKSEKAKRFMLKQPPSEGLDFSKIFHNCNAEGIDLLKCLLTINPRQRISVEEALRHPFLESLHVESEEPEFVPSEQQIPSNYSFTRQPRILENFRADFEIDGVQDDYLTKQMIQEGILQESSHFHPVLNEFIPCPTNLHA